ncbi:tigger transposable element-derived protein 3 isoform X2 [Protopterus annectens]|nr:tigger transposable element-derived protein 3 isoform X2 [Protopterus annectens]XP_043931866.1 tigger transposable element-derived protein 3 isoform X2 [Protopterus annectens]XP_043931867.1 tigger transposable element-derived protein 3 isoform X2 [Protopterus annectens]XP_043931868.1 tigger transposable element-derived protein 3 isoform X2 [Protopterus annectens]
MELHGKKKLHALSLAEKIQVLEILDESKMSQSEIARRFQVSQPQISRICKNKEKLLAEWCSGTANKERKRRRESKYSSIDEALLCWFHIARTKTWDITGPMLLQKAKELAEVMGQEFVPSIGWLVRWKRRNNVCFGQRHNPQTAYLNELSPDDWIAETLPEVLKSYSPENIFGCDETTLLFRMIPEIQNSSSRKLKECISILLCVNSCGTEKVKPLVVSKYVAPHCFYGVNIKTLPALYRGSTNGWITSSSFSEWLLEFDQEMGRQNRSVLLILNNDAVHEDIEMNNVKLFFLPPQILSSVSLLNTKIIQDFKCNYSHRLLGKMRAIKCETDKSFSKIANSITILDAVHMIAAAWEKVSSSLIENCFIESGFHKQTKELISQHNSKAPEKRNALELSTFVDFEKNVLLDLQMHARNMETCVYKEEDSDESDGEDLIDSLPTKADALKALATLRRWFECNGCPTDIFKKFYSCEEEVERLCSQ